MARKVAHCLAGRVDSASVDLANFARFDASARDRFPHNRGGQIVDADVRQRAAMTADRRPGYAEHVDRECCCRRGHAHHAPSASTAAARPA